VAPQLGIGDKAERAICLESNTGARWQALSGVPAGNTIQTGDFFPFYHHMSAKLTQVNRSVRQVTALAIKCNKADLQDEATTDRHTVIIIIIIIIIVVVIIIIIIIMGHAVA
jgi:hypothetical protein